MVSRTEANAARTAEEINAQFEGAAKFYAVDVANHSEVAKVGGQILADFSRIDILVNNAAYQLGQPGGIEDITTEQFDRVMRTNLYAMFWLCKKALSHMESGATIINTSSVQATHPSPELCRYLGEVDDARLGGGIVEQLRRRMSGLDRRGVDDRRARLHMRQRLLA